MIISKKDHTIASSDIYPINLTDFCNQSCSFCFAREEMTSMNKKQIDINNFKKIALKLKKLNSFMLVLLGGEPTLHTDFEEILSFSMKHFFSVRFFTNGVFSEKVRDAILQYAPRVELVINMSTPGFQFNKNTRQKVLENVEKLAPHTPITLSIVNLYMNTGVFDSYKNISPETLKKVKIKFSFMTPIVGDRNLISINDFPKVGGVICKLIKKLEREGPPLKFGFDRLFRPCMFSPKQVDFLKKRGLDYITKNTICHETEPGGDGYWSGDFFHTTSDLTTFRCYPLSTIDLFKVTPNNIKMLREKYTNLELEYRHTYVLPECKKCPLFGYEKGQCNGPCLSFRMNALRKEDIKKTTE